jgi:GTP diphosphokinase / guanosine-3',5'-bis(diphosphate) 3'-diphosphatase
MSSTNLIQEKENEEIVKAYRHLLRSCKVNLNKTDRLKIREAFNISLDAHKSMRRKSGEPYILHPIAVAQICAEEIGLGSTSIICALLHDTVEDTDITLDLIDMKFGKKVSQIIDGLTKISDAFDQQDKSMQAENFKKMLLTLSEDVRVILIKLADRLHNMRTLESMSAKSQLKIASETAYVYAPLAHRLGLYAIKTELEDLATKFLDPDSYKIVKNKLQETKAERNKYIKKFIEPIQKALDETYSNYEIKGRPKSIHSILTKMKKQEVSFDEVFDLFAIRIIIDDEYENEKSDCWKVYSTVTDFYTPNPDRLRDWVSIPKANGYESLHTTVMGPGGKWVEVQIRSKRMDEIAEKGYAAHWKYKDGTQVNDNGLEQWLARVRDMLENTDGSAVEFLDDFKLNLFAEEIFVFTPKGDLKKMPAQSTVLDFAFEIHSGLGAKCIGAKVNNKLVSINYALGNGDQVEILSSTKQKPSEDWLTWVATAKAKSKIRDYFKQERNQSVAMGKEILERKFKNAKIPFTSDALSLIIKHYKLPSVTELYYQLVIEKIDRTKLDLNLILAAEPVKQTQSFEPKTNKNNNKLAHKDAVIIGDGEPIEYSFAKCCSPIPGDDIFGFVTVGEGVKVHRTNCTNGISLMSNYGYRIIKSRWADGSLNINKSFLTSIKIQGIDSVGIVSAITNIISTQLQINMKSINVTANEGMFEGNITLQVNDTKHLEDLMNKIKQASQLISVTRVDIG